MSPDAWIPITIAAAFLQNVRSLLQKRLADGSTVHGGAYVRFLYALPLAWIYAIAMTGTPWRYLGGEAFWGWVAMAAIAQIVATACLLASFAGGRFAVGTVLSKTEAAQAALFGLVFVGEAIGTAGLVGIAISFVGVLVLTGRSSLEGVGPRTFALGLASGSFFGVAAVGFRAAALALPLESAPRAAAVTLAVALTIQTVVYGAFLAWREPATLGVVRRQWRTGLAVGASGMAASAGWFTAMALVNAALVRALGQVELVFTLAVSAFWLRERIGARELLGVALVVTGLVFVTLSPVR
ncbi:MAG TPA: DMT family transporter [Myxococcota bacterium]|nr:DMT family transporter [Myxococcota bacterium]